jgi:oxygen-independent coproporphyrinogen-3 oxidase
MLEVYIHIPFCVKKCKYCDFLSAPADSEAQNAYMDALCKEIVGRSLLYQERRITSIFIGGGTPTSISPQWIMKTRMATS